MDDKSGLDSNSRVETEYTLKYGHVANNLAESEVLESLKYYDIIDSINNKHPFVDQESIQVSKSILKLMELRDKWVMKYPIQDSPTIKTGPKSNDKLPIYDPINIPIPDDLSGNIKYYKGIYWFSDSKNDDKPNVLLSDEYIKDLCTVMDTVIDRAANSFADNRLKLLEYKFNLHKIYNSKYEVQELKDIKYLDFYNLIKVDTHIHVAAASTQLELIDFIRDKYNNESDTIVDKKDGKEVTLKEMFEELKINPNEASLDAVGINDQADCFHRFDKFNLKYNPFGVYDLRTLFLKVNNSIDGRYFGEICRNLIDKLERTRCEYAEWRISIYGRSEDEWQKLALWVKNNNLHSNHIRWVVQIPRIYPILKAKNIVNSFGDILCNIFKPLFEAIQNPKKYPQIYLLLHQIVAWDCVDDETDNFDYHLNSTSLPEPDEWTSDKCPPFHYFHYYIYANIKTLNELLIKQNIMPKTFRPHCGESGSSSHLASMFLLANNITHGLTLEDSNIMLYLYYLKQIPVSISPLGINRVNTEYIKQPYYRFFSLGLKISLSTDDPLMFHYTDRPLLEEYSTFAHIFKLDAVDMAELARNSVIQSGYEHQLKAHWLGPNYYKDGVESNSPQHTNTSNNRIKYRYDSLMNELNIIKYLVEYSR